MSRQKFNKFWYGVALLLVVNVLVWVAVTQSRPHQFGNLQIFDVGQGDAIYFRTPRGNDVLIDGGPGDRVLSRLGRAMPFTDRTIELVILTHPHADHVDGLIDVLKRFSVKAVMLPDVSYDSATYREFLRLLEQKHISVIRPKLGLRLVLDEATTLDILYPVVEKFDHNPADINDVSIVARLTLGKTHTLLAGDAGQDIEKSMLALHLPVAAEILKVGHHGSRHSSAAEFLAAVHPAYGVISVGKQNRYGHPHPETLEALAKQNIKILRTDEQGTIAFRLYPDEVSLQK